MRERDALAFEQCIGDGGVAIFPTDTVYGIGCDPGNDDAVRRLYLVKGRDPAKPAALMFFGLDAAFAALADLGPDTRRALEALLPGPVTAIVRVGAEKLGLRVPKLAGALQPLGRIGRPVLQTSANLSGGRDPRELADIPVEIREAVDLELDGGELTGAPSTVVDLSSYDSDGRYEIVREGALPASGVASLLG